MLLDEEEYPVLPSLHIMAADLGTQPRRLTELACSES